MDASGVPELVSLGVGADSAGAIGVGSTGAGIGGGAAMGGADGAFFRLGVTFFLGFDFFIIRFAFFFAPFLGLRFRGKQITRAYSRSPNGNKSSQHYASPITVSRQCFQPSSENPSQRSKSEMRVRSWAASSVQNDLNHLLGSTLHAKLLPRTLEETSSFDPSSN